MQPCTTSGKPVTKVGYYDGFRRMPISNHDPQQIGGRSSLPASDTSAHRPTVMHRTGALVTSGSEIVPNHRPV
ncbi:hypothetical protein A3K89_08350 [Rhodococcoides kyotonense]|uniref:Uncharacterized protein n=1 Tax=Rhodococcoides kyotonense TaxID=398843 RepID=A0A177YB80_9NOCA|nr:hypothetical protein A3K89_08350 [Rhodococcus kyotonensis]